MLQKIGLFIISIWFLFLLLFINKVQLPANYYEVSIWCICKMNFIPIVCLTFMIIGLVYYRVFNYTIFKAAPDLPITITEIKNMNFHTLSFLITYVIPLLCFDLDFNLDKERHLLMFFLVLLLIGIIYIRTNIFYTNPTLAIFGFRIYEITTSDNKQMIAISKGSLQVNDNIFPKLIDENIYFVKKEMKK